MHKQQLADAAAQDVAVTALERRTRHGDAHLLALGPLQMPCQGVEPVASVGVGQRHAGAHTRYVGGRMQLVAFDVLQLQASG